MPEKRTFSFQINESFQGLRLDVFLTQQIQQAPSRVFIQRMIESGQVTVNLQKQKANYRLEMNDQVVATLDESLIPSPDLKAEKMDLDIFYQDDDLVVIYKPSGLTVHPASVGKGGTLVNALMYHFEQLSDKQGEDRPGIVHRLDKDTSGLIVIAKNNFAHARLGRQFERHEIYKKYVAIVEGVVQFDQGLIDAPIKKHYKHHDMRMIAKNDEGKPSVTTYQVMKRFKHTTMVALFPQTGRTHQLRVHMRHIGHPLLGDDKYGQANTFSRLALHAQAIGFVHPQTQQYVEFVSPLPKEFMEYKD